MGGVSLKMTSNLVTAQLISRRYYWRLKDTTFQEGLTPANTRIARGPFFVSDKAGEISNRQAMCAWIVRSYSPIFPLLVSVESIVLNVLLGTERAVVVLGYLNVNQRTGGKQSSKFRSVS